MSFARRTRRSCGEKVRVFDDAICNRSQMEKPGRHSESLCDRRTTAERATTHLDARTYRCGKAFVRNLTCLFTGAARLVGRLISHVHDGNTAGEVIEGARIIHRNHECRRLRWNFFRVFIQREVVPEGWFYVVGETRQQMAQTHAVHDSGRWLKNPNPHWFQTVARIRYSQSSTRPHLFAVGVGRRRWGSELPEHAVDESVIEDHPPERRVTEPEQRGTCDARANGL